MNNEQLDVCQKYESVLGRAVKKNFLHISNSEFGEIAEVYDEVFTPLTKRERNCNSCRLKAIKKLGEKYFEELENAKVQAEEVITTVKKRGRPKKINLDE